MKKAVKTAKRAKGVKPAKSTKAAKSVNPNTAMRANGYVLVQTWASKKLKLAIDARAKATKKFKSDVIRQVLGKAAEGWSGAAAGSLQQLRIGKSSGSNGGGGGKTIAKSKVAKPAKRAASKGVEASKAAKSATKKTTKPAAKSAVKSSGRSRSTRGGAKPAGAVRGDGGVGVVVPPPEQTVAASTVGDAAEGDS